MKTCNITLIYPHYCEETEKIFNSNTSLSVFITKSLKYMSHKMYYDKYVKGDMKCYFCKNQGKFISITKGYRDLCDNIDCIKKSRSSSTIECIMYHYNCTIDEAENILQTKRQKTSNTCKITSAQNTLKNPNYLKQNSSRCIEFWIKKGYNEEEANQKLKTQQKNIAIKGNIKKQEKLKQDPKIYNGINTNQLEFWIKKGYTEKESKVKVTERQTTFSLSICIEKHGVEEGTKIWQTRQDKWQSNLNSKTDKEKLEINLKKMANYSGYSKISQELFWKVLENFNENNVIFQELSKKEIVIYNKDTKSIYKLDYVDFTNKKVIEFNGDYWHCNPQLYNETYYHQVKKKYSKDIWEYDNAKNNYIKNKGYDLLIIWESDYRADKTKVINECINFIKN